MTETGFEIGDWVENRYRVLDVIGSGGMGTLYRVSDEAHRDEVHRDGAGENEIIALKTVRLSGVATEASESVKCFQREFQLLTQLRHPNLVSVYDYGTTTGGKLYFTMEWVEGRNLEPDKQSLEPEATTAVMVQICRALAYLHARGVIHGDLKPQNVLVMAGAGDADSMAYRVKLVDFGLAHEIRSPEDRARYYTPGYSAPEVIYPHPVDQRADLYSMGAMWYALLVGKPATFMFGAERLIQLTLEEALKTQGQIPKAIGAVITRLMATVPETRYSSANEVIEAVNGITGSTYKLETRETAASYALRTHFINREEELEVLRAAWERAQADEGQVVLVSGEAGVGKTRLVAEMEVQAELEGARVVWGQCVERGSEAYRPWNEVLRVLVRYVESADEATGKTTMQQAGPVLAALLPQLWERDYMAGLEPPAELEPQAAQLRLNDAILQVMRTAARLRPTVIVVENMHWADEATLELLRYLSRVPGSVNLLVCATYRDDEVDSEHLLETLNGERVQRVRVPRLLPEVTTDLVCSMLGLERLPALLPERVYQTTGGNAFFVQELIRSLAAEGKVLRRTVEGWQVDGEALQKAQLPESIQQVVERRLVQLSKNARRVLEWAAVVGLVFWEEVVVELVSWEEVVVEAGQVMRAEVRAALGELIEQELVVVRDETSFVGEREYLFLNPTVREIGYESMPQGERRVCHSRVANWLITRSNEETKHLGLIAEHLDRAGQTEQAVTYLRRAGEQAAAQFANANAVGYFSRALELTPEDDLADRYALLLAREKVYNLQGARQAQIRDLEALAALAEASPDAQWQVEVALQKARYAEAIGDFPATIAAAQKAVRLAQATQDAISEAASYVHWGRALEWQGDYDAAQVRLGKALALARMAGGRQVEATCLHALGSASMYQGDPGGAIGPFEKAMHIYRELGDRRGEVRVLNSLGFAYLSQGGYARARDYLTQALTVGRETGNRRGERVALINLSLLCHHQGDNETAQEHCQRALLLTQEIGGYPYKGYVLTNLGHALMGLGHFEQAVAAYQQALDIRRELREPHLAMESLAGLARISLAQGNVKQAQAQVEEILSYLEKTTLDGAEEPFRVYLTCYHVLRTDQNAQAWTVLNTAYWLLQEQAAKITDEEMRRSFLENVAAHREIIEAWGSR